jgi:hypothetical protein
MSEAIGPVSIDEVNGGFRFRFKLKGSLAVEEWLRPSADNCHAVRSVMTVQKYASPLHGPKEWSARSVNKPASIKST